MPAAYPLDLRERVIDTVEAWNSRRHAATVFKVIVSTVIRCAKRVAETGIYTPLPSSGDQKLKHVESHKAWLLSIVAAEPDLTFDGNRCGATTLPRHPDL